MVAEGVTVAVRADGGDTTGYIYIVRDIAERERAEQATRESQRQTATILESVTDAFYALDRDWRLTYVNEQTVQFASQLAERELTRDEMLGQALWTLLPRTVGTPLEDHYRRAVREREPVAFEYRYPESEPWFEVRAYPSEEGLAIYFQEITERKRVEAQLAEVAHQQAALVEAERRRIARDLHDEALQEMSLALVTTTDERVRSSIIRVGEQLRAAIYDLRLEEEQARGFASALRELVALQAKMPGGSAIELDIGETTPQRELGEVGAELLRMAGEALTNARRHSGASAIRISTHRDGDLLRVEVTDDGKGVDPREEPTTRQSAGLRGVRERAELIGGRLQIDSARGRGTTVRIEAGLGESRSPQASASPGGRPHRVDPAP